MKKPIIFGVFLMLFFILLAFGVTGYASAIPPKSTWSVDAKASLFVTPEDEVGTAFSAVDAHSAVAKAIDGDKSTFWHSYYTAEGSTITGWTAPPHNVYITLPEAATFSGIELYPRKATSTDGTEILGVTVYVSDTAANGGGTWRKVTSVSFERLNLTNLEAQTVKKIDFGGNVTARSVRIEITRTLGGRYATISEINLIEENPAYNVHRVNWSIDSDDAFSYNPASLSIDGDLSTYWHSNYDVENNQAVNPTPCPHNLYITYPEVATISGVSIYPRQDAGAQVKKYAVYVSDTAANDPDDPSWIKVAESETFATLTNEARAEQPPLSVDIGYNIAAKKVRLEITESSNSYATIAEIDIWPSRQDYVTSTLADYEEYLTLRDLYVDDETGKIVKGPVLTEDENAWDITVSDILTSTGATRKNWCTSVVTTASNYGQSIYAAVDGIYHTRVDGILSGTYWHSYYEAKGSTITYNAQPPYTIEITLPHKVVASKLNIYPRIDSTNGCPVELSVWVSDTDNEEDYIQICNMVQYEQSTNKRTVDFVSNLFVKKVKILITSSGGGYGCISEIDLDGYDEYKDFSSPEYYEINAPYHALYEISKLHMLAWADPEDNWAGTHGAHYVIDGGETSPWQTISKGEYWNLYHEAITSWDLYVDLGDEYIVKKMEYVPRNSDDMHGLWTNVNIYTSTDNVTYTLALENLELESNLETKTITFNRETSCRYIKFEILDTYEGNNNRASCGELYFYQTKYSYDAYWSKNGGEYTFAYGSNMMEVVKGGVPLGMVELDGAIFAQNGYTYVPIDSFINDNTTGTSERQEGSNLLTYQVSLDNRVYVFQENNLLVPCEDPSYGDIVYTLPVFPVNRDGVLYIPLQFICKIMAYTLDTDKDTGTFVLTKTEFDAKDIVDWDDPSATMEVSEFVVSYNVGAGDMEADKKVSISQGAGVVLPEASPAEEGYVFRGWYEPYRIKRLAGKGGDTYTPAGEITLYALYSPMNDLERAIADFTAYLDSVDLSLYRNAEKAEIEAIIDQAQSDMESAVLASEVTDAYEAAQAAIEALPTDAFLALKETAISELQSYKSSEVYRTKEAALVAAAKAAGERAINEADTAEGVQTALGAAKSAVDAIKTDSELMAEEDSSGYKIDITPTMGGSVKDDEDTYREGITTEEAGKTLALTAIPNQQAVFKAWIDSTTKKILSDESTYTFSVYSGRGITALFANQSDAGEHFVTFLNRNNQYISTLYVEDGENSETVAPASGAMFSDGYVFRGWQPALGPVTGDVDYVGIYEKTAREYRIVVTGGVNDQGEAAFDAVYDTLVRITADEAPEGKQFVGWRFNGVFVSYQPVYEFYVYGNIKAEAVYAEDAPEEEPLIVMMNVGKSQSNGKTVASFLTAMEVPEGFTYVESGVIYGKTALEEADLIVANVGTTIHGKVVKRTVSLNKKAQYKLSASYGDNGISARGYLIYLDGLGEKHIIYTDVVYRTTKITYPDEIEEEIDMDD